MSAGSAIIEGYHRASSTQENILSSIDNPLHDREVGVADATQDTTRIDDVRIGAVRPLISPALLQDDLPVPPEVQALVERSRAEIVIGGGDKARSSASMSSSIRRAARPAFRSPRSSRILR